MVTGKTRSNISTSQPKPALYPTFFKYPNPNPPDIEKKTYPLGTEYRFGTVIGVHTICQGVHIVNFTTQAEIKFGRKEGKEREGRMPTDFYPICRGALR